MLDRTRHTAGTKHRIDFLCVGGRAQIFGARSEINDPIDLANPRDDHYLLQLRLQGAIGGAPFLAP